MFEWMSSLLFQVGCGAIGCEMLKNFALLGVGLAKCSGEVGIAPCLFSLLCLTASLQFTETNDCICPSSGVRDRPGPHRKVQPQQAVSLQTTSYTSEYTSFSNSVPSILNHMNHRTLSHTPVSSLSQKPKSTTAAEATCDINPELQVDAHLNKVCPATDNIYSDTFYSRMNLVVTALDNVEARRYVDRLV